MMTMKGVLLTLVATLPSVAAFLGGKRIMQTMMMNKRKSFIGSYSSRGLLNFISKTKHLDLTSAAKVAFIFFIAVVAGLMGSCDCPCRTYTTKRCVPTYKERLRF